MTNLRKQAFAQRLCDYMLEERGSIYKQAASPIEYPQLQGGPDGGMPPEQSGGMDPAMLEQVAAATGMDPQQLAQMPPEQLDQIMQQMQGGVPQDGAMPPEAGQEGQGGQAGTMPSLNITAKGDIAVETVNNMMGTQKAASLEKKANFADTLGAFMKASRQEYMEKVAMLPPASSFGRLFGSGAENENSLVHGGVNPGQSPINGGMPMMPQYGMPMMPQYGMPVMPQYGMPMMPQYGGGIPAGPAGTSPADSRQKKNIDVSSLKSEMRNGLLA